MAKDKIITPGGVDRYIASCPVEARPNLQKMRAAIKEIAPDAIETVSYFQIPGYAYTGHDYSGMFVWFSYKPDYVRLHVRPPVIESHAKQVLKYHNTKSIISFPIDEELPIKLIIKLVRASLAAMKST